MTSYDPTCGSGSLLLKAAETARVPVSIFGQEMDIATRGLARMNMIMHNRATAEIAQGDVIAEPHFLADTQTLQTFDFVVANPPFSTKAWASGLTEETKYGRFVDGDPPAKNGDFAFLLHILASMKATGSGAVILPHGVLFRGNAEAKLREKILKRGYIKSVIGLPANLFYGTGIPAAIIVLDKSEASADRPVFMIDASKGFIKDGNKNRLRERDIHKIIDTFTRQQTIPGYSRLVAFEEITRNDFNLNIPRYIDGSDPEDLQDITAHLCGGVPERDIDALDDFWDVMPTLRSTLFGTNPRPGYADPLIAPDQVRATIRNHPDFVTFRTQVTDILNGWIAASTPLLMNIKQGDQGDAVVHIYPDGLSTLRLRLPPLSEQLAIAAALSDADEVVVGIEQVIAKKRLIKQGAMQDLLTARRRLPGFSGKWEVKNFAQIAKIRNSKVQTLGNQVAQSCIELEQIEHETGRVLFWVDATARPTVKYQFEPGDILFGRLRPYLRKFHRATLRGVCSTEIWPLMSQGVDCGFLYQVIQSNGFVAAACEAFGTHMPRADWGKLATYEVPVPVDPKEQAAIGDALEDMEKEIQAIESRLAKARAVKEGMMQNLLTGRVRLL